MSDWSDGVIYGGASEAYSPAPLRFDSAAYEESIAQDDMARIENAARANNVFSAPKPTFSVGDWTKVLTTVSDFATSTARTAQQIINQKNVLQAQQEETAFNRFLRSSQIELAKNQLTQGGQLEAQRLTIGGAIEKAKLQAALAIAERDARNAAAVPGSFFGIPIQSSAGGLSPMLILVIAGVGIYFLAKKK